MQKIFIANNIREIATMGWINLEHKRWNIYKTLSEIIQEDKLVAVFEWKVMYFLSL